MLKLKELRSNRNNLLLSLLATCGGLLFGYDMGIISGALLQLKSQFNLSCILQEIVVSTMLLGAIVASICGGFIVDNFGRKHSILISSLLYFIGAMILMFAWHYALLIIGRFTLGFAMSLASTAECVYVAEIAPKSIRGRLVSFNEVGITFGILLSYSVNALFSFDDTDGWRWMFGMSGVLAVILLLTTYNMPQSPRYLLAKGETEEALRIFKKVRKMQSPGITGTYAEEWNTMKDHEDNKASISDLFCGSESHVKYSLMLGIVLVIFQQSTGQPNIIFYASTIMISLGFESKMSATLASIVIGVVKVISTILCLIYIDKWGRRKFLLTGCMLMAISLTIISIIMLKSNMGVIQSCIETNSTSAVTQIETMTEIFVYRKWIVFVGIMIFVAAYAFSFGPITWLLLSEIFPTKVRGISFSLCLSLNWLTNLIISLTFLDFSYATGSVGWPFLLSSLLGCCSVVFVYMFVPETKDKNLEEIEQDILLLQSKYSCKNKKESQYILLPR